VVTTVSECGAMRGTKTKRMFFLFALLTVIGYSIPCNGLTVEEILQLKNAGVGDSTIQVMLEEERQGVREYSDDRGNTYIRYSTGSASNARLHDREEAEKVKRAWELLDRLIIDGRQEQ
jgi:hypothetical protein